MNLNYRPPRRLLKCLELVSKMPPERYPEARKVKEGVVNGEQMLVTKQQSAELAEPWDPEDTSRSHSIRLRRSSSPILPPLRLGLQGLNQLPVLISQQLLLLLHGRSSIVSPPQA